MCFANFVIFYNFFELLLLTDNNFGVILLLWHWTLRQFCCKIYVAAYAPAQAAAGQFHIRPPGIQCMRPPDSFQM